MAVLKTRRRARHRIRCIPPLLAHTLLREYKRPGYNQYNLTCRASSYSSRNHLRLLPYSHRYPTSMHQIRKQLSHPNLHRHHIQGDVLQYIAKAIHQSSSLIHFHKVESHAGIRGNNYADAFAKKSMTTYSNVADTSIKQLALREIISTVFTGLQKDMKNTKSYRNHPNTAQSPTSRLWYQSNLP